MTVVRWLTLALALGVLSIALFIAACVLVVLGAIGGETLLDPHYAAAGWCLSYGWTFDYYGRKASDKAKATEAAR